MSIPIRFTFAALALITAGCTQFGSDSDRDVLAHQPEESMQESAAYSSAELPSIDDIARVSPALARYTQKTLREEVWSRPGLSKRDRSIVTLAALVARGQPWAIRDHVVRALDNGVEPGEISELITHLAFYSGWGSALAAVEPTRQVFAERGIGEDQLPAAMPELLPLDEESEAKRAELVDRVYGPASPGVVAYTTNPLFRELWLRPDLAPRDRSLVTVSALIASGQSEQVTFHLNRAMDNGLTEAEASEVLTQLAFYAGWPRVFSAMPVVKDVFEGRKDR